MIKELQSRLQRYRRFLENEDARKTLAEVDAFFCLDEISLGLFDAHTVHDPKTGANTLVYKPHADKQFMLKEGARCYSQVLKGLIKKTEEQIEQLIEAEKGEEYEFPDTDIRTRTGA